MFLLQILPSEVILIWSQVLSPPNNYHRSSLVLQIQAVEGEPITTGLNITVLSESGH